MKVKTLLCCLLLAATGGTLSARPTQYARYRIKQVKVYPQGVYMTLTATANLTGEPGETVTFPDIWYMRQNTLQVKMLPESGSMIVQAVPAANASAVELQQQNLKTRDSLLAIQSRLEADSSLLIRQIEFLKANVQQQNATVAQLEARNEYMRKKYEEIYEAQRINREELRNISVQVVQVSQYIRQVEQNYRNVYKVNVQLNDHRAGRAEFELAYFSEAAEWKPVYFFRFDPSRRQVEVDYQATIRQWTGIDWKEIPAVLSYGSPAATLRALPQLYPRRVTYRPPAPKVRMSRSEAIFDLDVTADVAVELSRFGGTYTGVEAEVQESGAGAALEITEAEVNYQLLRPLTLAYSGGNRRVEQTLPIKKEIVPASYIYEVVPGQLPYVHLTARIPGWRDLNLTNGLVNNFYDGQMLSQFNLDVRRQIDDTLSIPLMIDPNVVVERRQAGDYQERVSGGRNERTYAYEIIIKNNKTFPVNLTVKDQYPLPGSDQVEVKLLESSGARIEPSTGMLIWELDLAPGEERKVEFTYTIRYPREGNIYF